MKPAEADRQRFQLHPSVNTWRTFDPAASIDADASLVNQVQSALQVSTVKLEALTVAYTTPAADCAYSFRSITAQTFAIFVAHHANSAIDALDGQVS